MFLSHSLMDLLLITFKARIFSYRYYPPAVRNRNDLQKLTHETHGITLVELIDLINAKEDIFPNHRFKLFSEEKIVRRNDGTSTASVQTLRDCRRIEHLVIFRMNASPLGKSALLMDPTIW